MREIKFRAYSHDLKKMYAYALPRFNGELWVHKNKIHNGEWKNIGCGVINDKNEEIADYSYSLMQYTGIKDKNGKEIYEGDILSVKHRLKGLVEVYHRENKVFENAYIFGGFDIRNIKKGELTPALFENTFEVIGNIYENPELLNQ